MLLDTSGLLSLYHRAEPFHAEAVQFFTMAQRRFTHNYVLAEFIALAQARRLPRSPVLLFVAHLLENPAIEVAWIDASLNREAMALLMARPDKGYSLCDAVSFVLMRRRGITDALTTDSHFEQEGFARLLT